MEFFIPIAFIMLGLGLLLVEIYLLPGLNVAGIAGLCSMLFGVGYAFDQSGWEGGLLALLGAGGASAGLLYVLWQQGAWNRFILVDTLGADEEKTGREREDRSQLLGQTGVTVTPMRPTGVVRVGEQRLEAQTEGEYIAAGSQVRIVAMDRRRYFVRLLESASSTSAAKKTS